MPSTSTTAAASSSQTGARAAAMPFIMIAVLIDMMSIGLIIPVLPLLVGSFTHSQADQAFWYGAVAFAFGIANFFASPDPGRAVRQPRSSPGDVARVLRAFAHLLRHRAGDRAVDVDRCAAGGRRDAVERLGGERIRRRHHAAGGARPPLRHARRDVRARLHPRPGAGRIARRDPFAAAVLRRRVRSPSPTGSTATAWCPSRSRRKSGARSPGRTSRQSRRCAPWRDSKARADSSP